jgi:WD40 repeat protein
MIRPVGGGRAQVLGSRDLNAHIAALVADPRALAAMAATCTSWRDAARGAVGYVQRVLEGQTGRVTALAADAGAGVLASGSSDGSLRLWEVSTGKCLWHTVREPNLAWRNVTALEILGNGLLASGYGQAGDVGLPLEDLPTIYLWQLSTGEPHERWLAGSADRDRGTEHMAGVRTTVVSLAGLPGDALATAQFVKGPIGRGVHQEPLVVWDTSTGELVRILVAHKVNAPEGPGWNPIVCIAAVPGDRLASSGHEDDGTQSIRLWDVETGQTIWKASISGPSPLALTSISGGLLAIGFGDTMVRLYDVSSGQRRPPLLRGSTGPVSALAEVSAGVLVSGSGLAGGVPGRHPPSGVRLWNVATGQFQRTLPLVRDSESARAAATAFAAEQARNNNARNGGVNPFLAVVGGGLLAIGFSKWGQHPAAGSDAPHDLIIVRAAPSIVR